jgi:hypothetical protein
MTPQEIYNKARDRIAATGLSRQGSNCMYRDGYGSACGVGALIEDEHYTPDMEGISIAAVATDCNGFVGSCSASSALATALNKSGVPTSAKKLLQAIQVAHDGALTARDALVRLLRVAERHGLTP